MNRNDKKLKSVVRVAAVDSDAEDEALQTWMERSKEETRALKKRRRMKKRRLREEKRGEDVEVEVVEMGEVAEEVEVSSCPKVVVQLERSEEAEAIQGCVRRSGPKLGRRVGGGEAEAKPGVAEAEEVKRVVEVDSESDSDQSRSEGRWKGASARGESEAMVVEEKETAAEEKEARGGSSVCSVVGSEVEVLSPVESVGRAVKEIKVVLDKLEDDGAARREVRRLRGLLDELVVASAGWRRRESGGDVVEVKEKEKVEVEAAQAAAVEVEVLEGAVGGENVVEAMEVAVAADVPPPDEAEERRVMAGAEMRAQVADETARVIDRWARRKAAEVGQGSHMLQIYDCRAEWLGNDVREGLVTPQLIAAGYSREAVMTWPMMRRKSERVEPVVTWLVRAPREVYIIFMTQPERRVRIKWELRRYGPYIDLTVCWKCLQYGHRLERCLQPAVCRRCGGAHQVTQCVGKSPVDCAICRGEGLVRRAHRANGADCPLHQALIQTLKRFV